MRAGGRGIHGGDRGARRAGRAEGERWAGAAAAIAVVAACALGGPRDRAAAAAGYTRSRQRRRRRPRRPPRPRRRRRPRPRRPSRRRRQARAESVPARPDRGLVHDHHARIFTRVTVARARAAPALDAPLQAPALPRVRRRISQRPDAAPDRRSSAAIRRARRSRSGSRAQRWSASTSVSAPAAGASRRGAVDRCLAPGGSKPVSCGARVRAEGVAVAGRLRVRAELHRRHGRRARSPPRRPKTPRGAPAGTAADARDGRRRCPRIVAAEPAAPEKKREAEAEAEAQAEAQARASRRSRVRRS